MEELAHRLVDRIKQGQSNIAKNWEGSTNDFIDAVESTPLIKDFVSKISRVKIKSFTHL